MDTDTLIAVLEDITEAAGDHAAALASAGAAAALARKAYPGAAGLVLRYEEEGDLVYTVPYSITDPGGAELWSAADGNGLPPDPARHQALRRITGLCARLTASNKGGWYNAVDGEPGEDLRLLDIESAARPVPSHALLQQFAPRLRGRSAGGCRRAARACGGTRGRPVGGPHRAASPRSRGLRRELPAPGGTGPAPVGRAPHGARSRARPRRPVTRARRPRQGWGNPLGKVHAHERRPRPCERVPWCRFKGKGATRLQSAPLPWPRAAPVRKSPGCPPALLERSPAAAPRRTQPEGDGRTTQLVRSPPARSLPQPGSVLAPAHAGHAPRTTRRFCMTSAHPRCSRGATGNECKDLGRLSGRLTPARAATYTCSPASADTRPDHSRLTSSLA